MKTLLEKIQVSLFFALPFVGVILVVINSIF